MSPCKCDTCIYGQKIKELHARQANDEDKKLIEDLYDRYCHADMDADYWKLKAKGLWPSDIVCGGANDPSM